MTLREIEEIRNILVIEGQNNASKYDFHLGDTIKFSPTQVEEILKEHFRMNNLINKEVVLDTIDNYMLHHMGLLDLKLFVTELPPAQLDHPDEIEKLEKNTKGEKIMLGTMEQRTEGMKKQAHELIEQAYNRGYKAGYEACKEPKDALIEKGMNMAWDAADTLNRMNMDEIVEVFADDPLRDSICRESLFSCCTPELAIEKIKEYKNKKQEEEQEIRVGDEIILNANSSFEPNTKAIIIMNDNSARYPYNVMVDNGDTEWVDRDTIDRKTGRTFPEISEVLKKMQDGE